ncbi:hypothetical protein PIB30_067750 [Stylosanthes scabra]|uniref:Bet v I/Major latex protein domain-containing protein n=1 Tax=Stylosanthes scabra TaxID=79078 RepID=A0ABU6QMM8_9FABA|nr:hypothetical protein [Stylosanthes scabra]
MAGVAGKLEVEIEVKSSVEKFCGIVKDFPTISKIIPDYKIIEITEGDGKVPGSIIKATVDLGSEKAVYKERIEGVDDAKRTLTYSVIDGDLVKHLKSYKRCVIVTPKVDNNGSIVKWSCDYEKASPDVPEPIFIKDFASKMFSKIDDYLLSA